MPFQRRGHAFICLAIKTQIKLSRRWVIARIVGSLLGIVVCLLAIVYSAQFGLSRLLSRYAVLTRSIPAAVEAVQLTPTDADAHRALANVFRDVQMYREASRQLEIAASLRPTDDYLWLELGTLRDELSDSEGALQAFDQAVAQAPFYAHTRWQRANLRLRMGRYDEAFAELREAARSNRSFLPSLIDLAWSLSKEDANVAEQLAGIESPDSRVAFARFLARKGKGKETVEQFRLAATSFSDENKAELVRELISARAYREAFDIWSGSAAGTTNNVEIFDGGFEGTIRFGTTEFGWNVSREQPKVEASLDTSDKDSGSKSLRIAFDGDSTSSAAIVSQTIIVKPLQTYRINFAVKAKDIVSGGTPIMRIVDARTGVTLGSSINFPQNSGWQKLSVDFTTPKESDAVVLKLVRNECQSAPCPIFGVIWLDSVSIEEAKQ